MHQIYLIMLQWDHISNDDIEKYQQQFTRNNKVNGIN